MSNKTLVIVESPSKSSTISKYLGSGYKVLASKGHIRDLAISGKLGLGVDFEHDFEPTYVPIKGKKSLISDLKKEVKNADRTVLATDPDREGEAISWHLKEALGLKEDAYDRVTFNEITKDKIIEAFNNPKKIDDDLVKSQETRRILDRLIGFRLSKLVQAKTTGKSAGRVQSVALKLIVDREKEIRDFKPEEYWTLTAIFKDFNANLFKYKKDDIKLNNEEEVDKVIASLSDNYKVESVQEKKRKKNPKLPFKTSTMQQEASNKLGFSSKKTMKIAQELYEGISLGKERSGLITYMRTDSLRFSDAFINDTKNYINNNYGKKYVGHFVSKVDKNAQDAHEAIRPTDINRTPESIKDYLSSDQYKLYELIYFRSLASIMSPGEVLGTTVVFDNNDYKFKTTGQVLLFDGYLKVYSKFESSEDKILPKINEGDTYKVEDLKKEQHFTEPPARYTEASLIKALEEEGIGRPSTYATIISTILLRKYAEIEKKRFFATDLGIEVTDKLVKSFPDIINVQYTAGMEDSLDKIADKKIDNIKLLRDFWNEFEPLVENAFKEMPKKEAEKTGELCPECGSELVMRHGKYGKFVACSAFPKCKYIKKEKKEESKALGKCPICKEGEIIERRTKKGTIFYGCSNYPKCKAATWDEPTLELCPKCNSMLINKNGLIKCSNKSCDYEK